MTVPLECRPPAGVGALLAAAAAHAELLLLDARAPGRETARLTGLLHALQREQETVRA